MQQPEAGDRVLLAQRGQEQQDHVGQGQASGHGDDDDPIDVEQPRAYDVAVRRRVPGGHLGRRTKLFQDGHLIRFAGRILGLSLGNLRHGGPILERVQQQRVQFCLDVGALLLGQPAPDFTHIAVK